MTRNEFRLGQDRSSLVFLANSFALRLARRLAGWAFVTRLVHVDSCQAFGASPPCRRSVSAIEPLLLDGASALLNVFLVELAKMVAEVISSVERIASSGALGIITKVRFLLRFRCMLVLVMSVEVCSTFKWLGIAAWK